MKKIAYPLIALLVATLALGCSMAGNDPELEAKIAQAASSKAMGAVSSSPVPPASSKAISVTLDGGGTVTYDPISSIGGSYASQANAAGAIGFSIAYADVPVLIDNDGVEETYVVSGSLNILFSNEIAGDTPLGTTRTTTRLGMHSLGLGIVGPSYEGMSGAIDLYSEMVIETVGVEGGVTITTTGTIQGTSSGESVNVTVNSTVSVAP
jgi:hypothetical protein